MRVAAARASVSSPTVRRAKRSKAKPWITPRYFETRKATLRTRRAMEKSWVAKTASIAPPTTPVTLRSRVRRASASSTSRL